ncbi:hypothetical protein VH12019_00146 [Vibrio phage VH1_2019]|uniref:Uncharacterized protein n=1 Tax=Vibrio phage VH1_2019 TaxID=2686307 RepID=A0A6B9STN5_9CAUD|nr:hypothetical protein VH12019_00146 [Vibrio phage VH1_2019]WOL24826.1 hypothetical protein [Vibrio phage PG216]
MKDKQQLKVRCSIHIAEQLMQLPEFRDMSVTKIFQTLSTDYLNKSAFQHVGAINGKSRNHHSYEKCKECGV